MRPRPQTPQKPAKLQSGHAFIAASIREFHASFLRAVRLVDPRHPIHVLQVFGLVALRRALWDRQALPECSRRKQPYHKVNLIKYFRSLDLNIRKASFPEKSW